MSLLAGQSAGKESTKRTDPPPPAPVGSKMQNDAVESKAEVAGNTLLIAYIASLRTRKTVKTTTIVCNFLPTEPCVIQEHDTLLKWNSIHNFFSRTICMSQRRNR